MVIPYNFEAKLIYQDLKRREYEQKCEQRRWLPEPEPEPEATNYFDLVILTSLGILYVLFLIIPLGLRLLQGMLTLNIFILETLLLWIEKLISFLVY